MGRWWLLFNLPRKFISSQIIIIMCTINGFVPRPKFSNIVFRETFEYDIHDIVIIINTYDMRIIFVISIFLTIILCWTKNQAVKDQIQYLNQNFWQLWYLNPSWRIQKFRLYSIGLVGQTISFLSVENHLGKENGEIEINHHTLRSVIHSRVIFRFHFCSVFQNLL